MNFSDNSSVLFFVDVPKNFLKFSMSIVSFKIIRTISIPHRPTAGLYRSMEFGFAVFLARMGDERRYWMGKRLFGAIPLFLKPFDEGPADGQGFLHFLQIDFSSGFIPFKHFGKIDQITLVDPYESEILPLLGGFL